MERTARPSDARYFDRGLDHRAAVLPGPEIKVAVSRDGLRWERGMRDLPRWADPSSRYP
jgi:hypothetical protein